MRGIGGGHKRIPPRSISNAVSLMLRLVDVLNMTRTARRLSLSSNMLMATKLHSGATAFDEGRQGYYSIR
jgi:hypothetical protein